MSVATFPGRQTSKISEMREAGSIDWAKVAACGALITGGLLLVRGQKRAGLVMAASGTALALLDHEESLRRWWEAMPGYVERAQEMLEQVQNVVENVAEKGESLRRVLSRRSSSVPL